MVLSLLVLLGALFPFASAYSQAYPTKPVRFIVIVATGGGLDATARFIAAHLAPKLGQPVVSRTIRVPEETLARNTSRAPRLTGIRCS
jgi:tripartite-type tricarboxylate transporter receptor subunit TctC